MAEALWLAIAAAVSSFVVTQVLIPVLPRLGLVSAPDPNHPSPVPVGGGIALWIVSGAGLWVMALLGHPIASLGKIFLGASALFFAGVWDDVRLLSPGTKLLVQVTVASVMIIMGVVFPLGPGLEWVAVPLTLLWFVGLCNAFNLVDNMDGMLPGIAAVAATFVGLFAFATGRPETGLLSWMVAGACLGFLRYNLPPARIFLGDSGSMFLGFLLAGLAIGDSWRGLTQVGLTVLAPTLLLAVPIFNTTFVTITRKLSGIPVRMGKADHINYRLLAHGLSRGRALGAVYALSIVAGAFGLLVVTVTPLAYAAGATAFVILLMYLGVFLYEGRVQDYYGDFEVAKKRPGWEESPWYRWVIRIMAVTGDVLLVFTSLYAAFYLRFDGNIPADQLQNLAKILPYLILFRVGLALVMGVYETRWRLGLAPDALRLVWSVALGTLLFTALVLLLRLPSFPRTVIVIEGVMSLLFFGATRLGVRGLGEVTSRDRDVREGRRTIVAGSSDGFLTVYRALRDRNDGEYHIIGFADDDPLAHRSLIAGVRVLGTISKLPALARLAGAEHVIFCFPAGQEHDVERHLKAVLAIGLTAEVARLEVESGESWLRSRTRVVSG